MTKGKQSIKNYNNTVLKSKHREVVNCKKKAQNKEQLVEKTEKENKVRLSQVTQHTMVF